MTPWDALENITLSPMPNSKTKPSPPDVMTLYPFFLLAIYQTARIRALEERIAELEKWEEI